MISLSEGDATIYGTGLTLLSYFIGYGVTKEKVRNLVLDLNQTKAAHATDLATLKTDFHEQFTALKQEQKNFVTFQHFEAVVTPLRKQVDDVQRDIKDIQTDIKTLLGMITRQVNK